jgi:putative ABC transport system substrate-binding protein
MRDDARSLPRAPLTAFWLADPWTPERPRRVVDLRLHPPHHRGMDRRRFLLTSLAGALAVPRAADAQPIGRIPRVGVVAQNSPLWEDFRQGLRDLGYVEGRTILLEYRWGEGSDERLPRLAADLARVGTDVIVTWGTPSTLAAKNVTKTVPIVMLSGDPVGTKLVASLARPGGNITGLSAHNPGLEAKRLELLRELVPKLSQVAVLWNPANPLHDGLVREAKATATQLGVRLDLVGVKSPTEFDTAFAALEKKRPDALIVQGDIFFYSHRIRIVEFASKSRLPAVFTLRGFADAGGLLVYGASYPEMFRRAATYVDKILKGAKPADLPVEQPTKFELVINLKTARALGLIMPPSLLLRADQVIE